MSEDNVRKELRLPWVSFGSDASSMAPEGVSVHVARVLRVDTRTFADPPHPDEATARLAALPMHAIVFAFTPPAPFWVLMGSRR